MKMFLGTKLVNNETYDRQEYKPAFVGGNFRLTGNNWTKVPC